MKFQRTYQLSIQVGDVENATFAGFTSSQETVETIVISYPLTLEFDVTRNTLVSANQAHFRIFNLSPDTRKRIFHDRNQTLDYKQIRLQAGYEGQSPLPVIFQGNVMQAYSMRQGTNWVTEIEAFDAGFGIINGQVAQTVPSGWDLREVIKSVFNTIPNVTAGAIGDVETNNSRGLTMMGNSWNVLSTMATGNNAQLFADNETANFLNRDEYIANAASVTVISPDTGILETPRRSNNLLEVSLLFEPRLAVGQVVQLQSLEQVYNNGTYKVLGVAHRGMISGAVSGNATTTVSMDLGAGRLNAIEGVQ